jgi:hypothetical protein
MLPWYNVEVNHGIAMTSPQDGMDASLVKHFSASVAEGLCTSRIRDTTIHHTSLALWNHFDSSR